MNNMEEILAVSQLAIAFENQGAIFFAIKDLSFKLYRGETYCLLGESGCGKSMTALAIMRLLPASAKVIAPSEIHYQQQNLLSLPEVSMRQLRGRRIGMIFQEPMLALNPVLTVAKQIDEVLKLHFKYTRAERRLRILELLASVGLPAHEHILKSYPHQLSGGMKQRVMIAMVLAGEPEIIIADEPTSALDVTVQAQILTLLKQIQQQRQLTLLLITHDLAVVKHMADRIGVMYAGHIVEEANREIFFRDPKHPYTQKLFACLPAIHKRQYVLAAIPGVVPKITSAHHACRFASRCDWQQNVCHQSEPNLKALSAERQVRCFYYEKPELFPNVITAPLTNKIQQHEANSISNETVLTARQIKIYFPIKTGLLQRTVGFIKAVEQVNFNLRQGETLAIVGESGSGKTTLARGLLGLLKLTDGKIVLNNQPANIFKRQDFLRQMQLVFQDPFSAMDPRMLIGDIILEGMRALHVGQSDVERHERIRILLSQVGLAPEAINRYPHEFSGGQRQRIVIARALAVNPKIMVLDEPTSALDMSIQAQILNLLKELQAKTNVSYLLITHNLSVVAYMANYVLVMRDGEVVEQGEVTQILQNPRHEYTQKLIAASVIAD